MNRLLFALADFLSKPPGFYWMLAAMLVCCIAVPFGINENLVTFGLSVAAIVITGVVLIQGYRDTAAIQAKLDELVLAMAAARNEVIGLEKREPEEIAEEIEKIESEAQGENDMPSKSGKQARFMAAASHDPKFAKRVGIDQKTAKDFNQADKGTGILKKRGKTKR